MINRPGSPALWAVIRSKRGDNMRSKAISKPARIGSVRAILPSRVRALAWRTLRQQSIVRHRRNILFLGIRACRISQRSQPLQLLLRWQAYRTQRRPAGAYILSLGAGPISPICAESTATSIRCRFITIWRYTPAALEQFRLKRRTASNAAVRSFAEPPKEQWSGGKAPDAASE